MAEAKLTAVSVPPVPSVLIGLRLGPARVSRYQIEWDDRAEKPLSRVFVLTVLSTVG